MIRTPFFFAVALAGLFVAQRAAASEVKVTVSGTDQTAGEIVCRLYRTPDGFPEGLPVVATQRIARPGSCSFSNLEPGTYAVVAAILPKGVNEMPHDFLGRPKLPWGVSNNVRPAMRKPRFEEAAFRVEAKSVVTVAIRLAK